jgi:hypothetical protein
VDTIHPFDECLTHSLTLEIKMNSISNKYMETPILIPPNWQLEFHVHTNASLLAIGAMLAHNPIGKYDHHIVYVCKFLNKA